LAQIIMFLFKCSPGYQAGVKVTQWGWGSEAFGLGGFIRDKKGIYHAKQNGWQSWKYVGYNGLYDMAFDLGSSMLPKISEFSASGVNFRLWMWKGDYLNLGAGAEIGIYYGGPLHWLTGTDYAMPMTLGLYDNKGNMIFDWNPKEKNWWITGFNPDYQNVKASNLTLYGTINFSENKDMWKAFFDKYNGNSMFWFDKTQYKVNIKW